MQEIINHRKFTTLCTTLEDQMKKFGAAISVIVIFSQLTSSLPLTDWAPWSVSPANAVLYSPETKLPRTGELALRKAIPANTNMKTIQVTERFIVQNFNSLCTIYCEHSLILLGFLRGHLVFAKDTTEKAIWNNGG